jgi:hypothetical protein
MGFDEVEAIGCQWNFSSPVSNVGKPPYALWFGRISHDSASTYGMEVFAASMSTLMTRIAIRYKVSAVDEKLTASERRRRGAYKTAGTSCYRDLC